MIYSTQSVESHHFLVIRMGSSSTFVLCSGFGLCMIMFSIRGATSASITITATLIRSGPPQAQAQWERLQQLLSADTFVFSWQLNKFRASIIIFRGPAPLLLCLCGCVQNCSEPTNWALAIALSFKSCSAAGCCDHSVVPQNCFGLCKLQFASLCLSTQILKGHTYNIHHTLCYACRHTNSVTSFPGLHAAFVICIR